MSSELDSSANTSIIVKEPPELEGRVIEFVKGNKKC